MALRPARRARAGPSRRRSTASTGSLTRTGSTVGGVRSTRTSTRAPSRSSSIGASRAPSSSAAQSSRPSTQPIGVFSSALRSRVDRAGDDQPVDRARHRHVVEAQALGLVLRLARVLDVLVVEHAVTLAGHRVGDAEAEAAVGEAEDLVGRRRVPVASRVGDDDHLELEPLGGMDRQQAHRVRALLLGDRVALGGADRLLLLDEADEALDVGTAQLLVGAREPRELAQVRVAAAAVPLSEHGEVVVVVGDDPLAEPLEREPRGRFGEAVVALPERAQEPDVTLVEVRRQRALEPGEDRRRARPAGSAAARRSRHRRTARRARRRAPRRRSGSGAAGGTRAGRRPAAGRSSRGPSRGRSAARPRAAPPRTTRRRCPRRRAGRSPPRWQRPLSTSSFTRRATCRASARRQWTPLPA